MNEHVGAGPDASSTLVQFPLPESRKLVSERYLLAAAVLLSLLVIAVAVAWWGLRAGSTVHYTTAAVIEARSLGR